MEGTLIFSFFISYFFNWSLAATPLKASRGTLGSRRYIRLYFEGRKQIFDGGLFSAVKFCWKGGWTSLQNCYNPALVLGEPYRFHADRHIEILLHYVGHAINKFVVWRVLLKYEKYQYKYYRCQCYEGNNIEPYTSL